MKGLGDGPGQTQPRAARDVGGWRPPTCRGRPGHPFYRRLNHLLAEAGFDDPGPGGNKRSRERRSVERKYVSGLPAWSWAWLVDEADRSLGVARMRYARWR